MKSLWQIIIYLFAGVGATCVLGTAIWFGSSVYERSHREESNAEREPVAKWQQPSSLDKFGGPYFLAIFGVPDAPPQMIYIGAQQDHFTYGQFIDMDIAKFGAVDEPTFKSFLDRSSVEWTEEGVRIVFPSGHAFFAPRSSFPKR